MDAAQTSIVVDASGAIGEAVMQNTTRRGGTVFSLDRRKPGFQLGRFVHVDVGDGNLSETHLNTSKIL
ncbi:hypothetical protein [uncultured Tateyamaria sp.]|uniref:hypothetical protein n=1 Tax=uncultured Tateyamaria sp. TaxID=455651 RepID=UPI00260BBC86|nr:hypothetical protein [uncultured Tateyamaria sp.]